MSIQNNKLPDNPNIEVIKAKETGLFTNYIFKAIPLAFDESMSYYETLCGLLNYLQNTILPTLNNNADAVSELQNLYIELKTYVDNYFTNLDVQEEINNKLDAMVTDGTLNQIINQEIFGNINNNLTKLNQDNLDNMVVVGDSYTALSNSNWAELVAQQLHLTLYKHATSSMGYVHAIQNKTFIDNLTWGMTETLRLKTKYLICYGGLNDLKETPSQVKQAVIDFCTQAKIDFPNAHIIIVGPQSDIPNANSKNMFNIIRAIYDGAVTSNVSYADAHTWLYDTPNGFASTYANDNTHPNALGYKIIASKMLSLIIGNVNDKASIIVESYNNTLAELTNIRTTQNLNSTHLDMRITNITMTKEVVTKLGKVSSSNLGFVDTRNPLMILGYNTTYNFYNKLIGFAIIGNNGDINGINFTDTDYTGAIEVVGDIELTYNNQ